MKDDSEQRIWDIVDILQDPNSPEYMALFENKEIIRVIIGDALMATLSFGATAHVLSGVATLSFVIGYQYANGEDVDDIELEEDIWGSLDDYLGLSEEE